MLILTARVLPSKALYVWLISSCLRPTCKKPISLVIVSDVLDYLFQVPEQYHAKFARVASDGLVLFAGLPGQQRAKVYYTVLSYFISGISIIVYVASRLH
ncbi:hypothetical protein YC2023_115291 [Brassica napus]